MKILITASGGGHFSAALPVIEQLKKKHEILLVIRKYAFEGDKAISLEYQTAQKLSIPFKTITTGRLQRKFTLHTIPSLLKTPIGLVRAFQIVKEFKPDVVVTFGGYITLPVVISSALLSIPIVVHEQVLESGFSNKINSLFAKKVCVSWPASLNHFFPKKTVLTGNPVDVSEHISSKLLDQLPKGVKIILVLGGSSGSHQLNLLIEGCINQLTKLFVVIHQTGEASQFRDYERLSKLQLQLEHSNRYFLVKFINPSEINSLLAKADLVVSRAGINTVTRLLALGKPALLIPLPYSQNDEQKKNALLLQETGLGEILEQDKTSPDHLFNTIQAMIKSSNEYEKHKDQARKLIHKDAAEKIKEVILSVIS